MPGDLLASIRAGAALKHVDKSEIRDASSAKPSAAAAGGSSNNTNDLAAALALALSQRNDAFGSDGNFIFKMNNIYVKYIFIFFYIK